MKDDIKPEDLSISSWSSKPTYQWGIGTEQGVLIVHLPTGVKATCDSERSQHKNRAKAMEILRQALGALPEKDESETASLKVSRQLHSVAESVDNQIAKIAGERVGFSLIVFTEGRASYISNCDREVVKRELKNLLEYWEGGTPDIKAHDVN